MVIGFVGVAAAQDESLPAPQESDTTLEWPVEQAPFQEEVWSDGGEPGAGHPDFASPAEHEWNYGDPGIEGPNAQACLQLWGGQPWNDFPNIGDSDRSVAILVNQAVTIDRLSFAVGLGRATDITIRIREVIGAVRQNAILAEATKNFPAGGGAGTWRELPIHFTFLPGKRYDLSAEGNPGWGFNINMMRLYDFNNPTLNPVNGFDIGAVRILDGGAGGNYGNTLTPFFLFCDFACVNPVDLRNLPGNFDQSSFGRANTQLYAQSVVACNQYLSEVRVAGTHSSGNDVLFDIRITGARLDTGGMGAAPNFADIKWSSGVRRFPSGGGLTEVTVNPNIGVNVGQTYFIVLDAFSHPTSGLGTVRATQFNGPNDQYAGGEFVFINQTNENALNDFNAKTWAHRRANNEDLAVRAVFTAGEAPRAGVIDFQALEHHDALITNHGATYDEEGYRLSHIGGAALTTFGTQASRYPQSTALFNNTVNATTRLSRINGAAFDLIEMKLAELNGPNPAPVNFTGFKQGGGQVVHNVNTDGNGPQNGLERFVFPNTFTNLTHVEWAQTAPFHQFDDIVVRDVQGINCNLIGKFTNKCKNGKMKSVVKSGLPGGTVLTITNNGVPAQMTLNINGKGKLKVLGQANIAHTMVIRECPARTCVVADCNGSKCSG